MAKRKEQPVEQVINESEEQMEQTTTETATEEVVNQETQPESTPAPVEESKQPAVVELTTPKEVEGLAPAKSKEEIEASIQEKLSRKTDKDGADPFVPNLQLEKEVKEIANKNGFPLSRGTEVGARLMARAKRN